MNKKPDQKKKKTEKISYYGGEIVKDEDEESAKIYALDCHKKQQELYEFAAESSYCLSLPHAWTSFDSFMSSGLSRMHLFESNPRTELSDERCLKLLQGQITLNLTANLPEIPKTLEEECNLATIHGFPLLIWPVISDKQLLAFLLENYADCHYYVTELIKCQIWVRDKWEPLMDVLGLLSNPSKLDGVSHHAIGANLVRVRYEWHKHYIDLIKSFLVHRTIFSAGFHTNSIHANLERLRLLRHKSLREDSEFMKLLGDRLILANKACKGKKFSKDAILEAIDDPEERKECHGLLLTKNEAKMVLLEDNNDEEEASSDDNDSYIGSDDNANKQLQGTDTELKNRPVDKHIMANKGMIKYRHKRERNPRVHMKHKYKKATIRYRSRVAPVLNQMKPYGGETKGIRVNARSKSFKFNK